MKKNLGMSSAPIVLVAATAAWRQQGQTPQDSRALTAMKVLDKALTVARVASRNIIAAATNRTIVSPREQVSGKVCALVFSLLLALFCGFCLPAGTESLGGFVTVGHRRAVISPALFSLPMGRNTG